jgi:hypothetical protein
VKKGSRRTPVCTTVITPDGRWLHCIADLEMEGIHVPGHCVAEDWDPFECLCGVAVAAVLNHAGVEFDEEDGFFLLL